ncbi:MAG: endonuclease MutS2 [Bacteroidetes bacterium]|nr:endonuclease MutS2 [Bacteroidota bacterium]
MSPLKNYPQHIEEKLGFDQIRSRVAAFCFGPLGKELTQKASFSTKKDKIRLWLGQVHEWIVLLDGEEQFPEGHYLDISKALNKLNIEGFFLSEDEFHQIRLSLRTIDAAARFFHTHQEDCPLLFELIKEVAPQRQLIQEIEKVIDEEGHIRNNASQELNQITSTIAKYERELHKKTLQIYRKAKEEGWTADTDISVREGRLVIPVLAEHKRKLKGIVHDESGSGQILYIEPSEIIELNNELRELQLERRREIEKILRTLTARLVPEAPALKQFNQKLGVLDFIRAKALFARDMDARVLEIREDEGVDWKKAFHPLLLLHHRVTKSPTLPLNIHLDKEGRILIISGPNAGGKSVTLKSTGLLQYMTQCGFPVPVGDGSVTQVFKQIFIDIGDEQSLDNDLSTYSSHLNNMRHFLHFARKGTLILIDEFGTGTDPQFGGPMAEAILEELNRKNCYGVITTHYSNLKLMANRMPGLINGAMAYDADELQPLYRLEIGKPGSSFAFEVAAKIGLPDSIIQRARKKVGAKQKNVDDLLISLEKEKMEALEQMEKAKNAEAHYERLKMEYNGLKQNLEERRKIILQQAREEAYSLLKNSNSLIERTVRELKETAKNGETKTAQRKELNETRKKLENQLKQEKTIEPKEKPLVGDQVKIIGQSSVGRLLEIHKNKATVEFGEMRTQVDLKRLEKVGRKEARSLKHALGGFDTQKEMAEFKMDIDLRGKRGDEAVKEAIAFLDRAIILGFDKIRVIHGRGDGILKKLIRQEFKQIPAVDRMENEHEDFGGDGITVVYLK